MYPEIRQDHPGNCPKCGMTLEPEMPAPEEDENPELADFKRRFWWTLPFTVAVVALAMARYGPAFFGRDRRLLTGTGTVERRLCGISDECQLTGAQSLAREGKPPGATGTGHLLQRQGRRW